MPDANEAALPAERSRKTSIAIILAALAGFAASVAMLYPGQYPFDSAYQLWQARTGQYSNITPVPMPALWSMLLRLTADPASLLCLNLAMFWTGSALLGLSVRAALALRLLLVLAPGLWLPNLAQLAHLLSDSHLTGVLMLAAGLIALSFHSHRRGAIWLSAALLIHAGSIRHNALIAILPLCIVIACFLVRGDRRRRGRIALVSIALCLASLLFGGALDRSLVIERRAVWPTIALWDLAAVSIQSGQLLLPGFTRGPGLSVEELVETGAFDPTSNTTLFTKSRSGIRAGMQSGFSVEQLAHLRGAWLTAVIDHPVAYLKHRLRTFHLLVGRHGDGHRGTAYYLNRIAYRDNPELPAPIAPAAQQWLNAINAQLLPTWAFSALPYLMMSLIAVGVTARRRKSPMHCLVLGLAGSALLYAASFFLLAPSAELRYLTWPMIIGPIALALSFDRTGLAVRPLS